MKKAYRYKDEDMLIAALTLCAYFEDHKRELIPLRSEWQAPFLDEFKQRINKALDEYIGKSTKKDLAIATIEIVELQREIHQKLTLFKTQIENSIRNDPAQTAWLLAQFGFDEYWLSVRRGIQEQTIALLLRIKNNLTADVKDTFQANGIPLTQAKELAAMADTLANAELKQETLKTKMLEANTEARKELNAIYTEAITICNIAKQRFIGEKTSRSKFIFSRLVSQMHSTGK